jgi:hypothetical protein
MKTPASYLKSPKGNSKNEILIQGGDSIIC